MMNELADSLENLSQRIELAHVEQDSKTVICSLNDLNQEVWKSREAIIKALRFAADMETLMPCSPKFFYETAEGSMGPVQVVRCEFQWTKNIRMVNWERDIYTAARKAVEELEKGE